MPFIFKERVKKVYCSFCDRIIKGRINTFKDKKDFTKKACPECMDIVRILRNQLPTNSRKIGKILQYIIGDKNCSNCVNFREDRIGRCSRNLHTGLGRDSGYPRTYANHGCNHYLNRIFDM